MHVVLRTPAFAVRCAAVALVVTGSLLSPAPASAEYLRLTTTVRDRSRLPSTFDELVHRFTLARLVPTAPGPLATDPYLGYGCGGEYGYVTLTDGVEYIDLTWYEYESENCAQQHVDEVTTATLSYGGVLPVMLVRESVVIQVGVYASESFTERVLQILNGG
jgi:hypothetical protein